VAIRGTPTIDPPAVGTELAVAVVTSDELATRRIVAALEDVGIRPTAVSGPAEGMLSDGVEPLPDVIVLMAAATDAKALSTIRNLTARPGGTQVVVVVDDGHWSGLRQVLNAGATGVIYESQLETTLVPTIRAALAGQISLPGKLRRCAVPPAFSHREKQVLTMVVRGFANRQIAAELYVAESTVKSHLASAFQKLGVHSRKEAAALLMDPHEGIGPSVFGAATRRGTRADETLAALRPR
jgi:DNA-binding NarL/FixJ family response regulator